MLSDLSISCTSMCLSIWSNVTFHVDLAANAHIVPVRVVYFHSQQISCSSDLLQLIWHVFFLRDLKSL